jgi:transposase
METFFLGGDVSKGYCDFIMLNQEKDIILKAFQHYDNAKGHYLLESELIDFCSNNPDCKIIAGVESTGGYENNWFESLCDLQDRINISVARINPICTHHSSKASLTRVVNDKKSARTIAEYLINYGDILRFKKPDKLTSLKRQWKFIRILDKQKSQLYNQLERNLYNANPELLRYAKRGYSNWLLRVIMRYPTARDLAKARVSSLSTIPYVTQQRAELLIKAAKSSVASVTDSIIGNLIVSLAKDITGIKNRIDKQSKLIADNCKLKEIELLKSFNGIGDYSAIGLLIYIGDVDNYACSKNLSSFSGLHPTWKQSGDGIYGMHISKKGNKEIRALLYCVALSSICYNPLIKEIYRRHVSKGMNKTAALVVCMHKILRIVYGMLKHKEMFNPEKDRANSTKAKMKHVIIKNYLPLDPDAPLSSRQYKKRKQLEMSKDDNSLPFNPDAPLSSRQHNKRKQLKMSQDE